MICWSRPLSCFTKSLCFCRASCNSSSSSCSCLTRCTISISRALAHKSELFHSITKSGLRLRCHRHEFSSQVFCVLLRIEQLCYHSLVTPLHGVFGTVRLPMFVEEVFSKK